MRVGIYLTQVGTLPRELLRPLPYPRRRTVLGREITLHSAGQIAADGEAEPGAFLRTLCTGPTDYDRISVAPRITTVHFPGSPRSSREEYLLDWNATLQGVLCTPPLRIVFALLLTGCARGLRIAHNPMQMASAGGADLKLKGPEGTPEAASPAHR